MYYGIKTKRILKDLQYTKKLLDKAISKLSDKGILVYCNCSMQFEEGEKVIDFLLKKIE